MSEENIAVVRRSVEALQRGDLDEAIEPFDPEISWEEMPSLGPDAAVYEGRAKAREAIELWLGMWSDYEADAVRYIDVGDHVVLLSKEHGRGRESGVVVERELGVIHTLREGKIVRSRLFGSWSEALEAAGLSENDSA